MNGWNRRCLDAHKAEPHVITAPAVSTAALHACGVFPQWMDALEFKTAAWASVEMARRLSLPGQGKIVGALFTG